ncbi:MAG: radical SAM protein [Bacillus subtilis]|nr:radical SAM protein [Bacillus subtilis]
MRASANGRSKPIQTTSRSTSIRLIKAKGVTRLSIGVQSGHPELLRLMGRTHAKEDVERAMKAVHDARFFNVNLDFIYAVPTETMADSGKRPRLRARAQAAPSVLLYADPRAQDDPLP